MIYHWSRLATGLIRTCISAERYPCPSVLLQGLSTHLNKIKVFAGLLWGQRIKHSTVKQDFSLLFAASAMHMYADPGKSLHLLQCLSSPTGKISTTMYKHTGEMTFECQSSLQTKQNQKNYKTKSLQWIKSILAPLAYMNHTVCIALLKPNVQLINYRGKQRSSPSSSMPDSSRAEMLKTCYLD